MLGSAETSKIAGGSESWITVSRGDAEFIKTRRSQKTDKFRICSEKVYCEQQLVSQCVWSVKGSDMCRGSGGHEEKT